MTKQINPLRVIRSNSTKITYPYYQKEHLLCSICGKPLEWIDDKAVCCGIEYSWKVDTITIETRSLGEIK